MPNTIDPPPRVPDQWPKWEYTDDIAQMEKRITALESAIVKLTDELVRLTESQLEFKVSVARMADYQGVLHLLRPW